MFLLMQQLIPDRVYDGQHFPTLLSHHAAFSLAVKSSPSESTHLTTGRHRNRDSLRDKLISALLHKTPNNLHVQPRSRNITSKIGIGIPRSQSKMYPVAAVSFILIIKRIVDILSSGYWLEFFVCAGACFDNSTCTIGAADDCLIRHNPTPRDDFPRTRNVTWEKQLLRYVKRTCRSSSLAAD